MRRIGNRLQLALRKWKRTALQMELFHFRVRWGRKFGEYECVGGPLDGQVRKCDPRSLLPADHGYYEFDAGDCRLHYRTGARISSWSDGL
jgi:hypothetical protein